MAAHTIQILDRRLESAGNRLRLVAPIALGTLTLIFAGAVARYGAVLPEDRYACLAALGLTAALYWFLAGGPDRPLPLTLRLLPGALLVLGALQLVPLPLGLVEILSTARVDLYRALPPELQSGNWIPLSIEPAATFAGLLSLAGYFLVFFLARDLAWGLRERPWILAIPFVVVALLEAVLGLVQYYGFETDLARGTYINRNHFAGLLEMALPFAGLYAVALVRRRRCDAVPATKACFWLAAAAVMLIAVVHSMSRMGFLATLGSLFVMGSLALGGIGTSRKRWFPVAAVGVVVLAALVFLPTDRLMMRFAEIDQAGARIDIWRDTMSLIQAYPVTGCGLGCYESGLYAYKSAAPMLTIDRAHNDYLQLMAEFGLVGFALLLALAVRALGMALRAAASPPGSEKRYLGIACAGSLTAIALHSLTDFNLYIPANALLLAWILGLSEGLTFASNPRR